MTTETRTAEPVEASEPVVPEWVRRARSRSLPGASYDAYRPVRMDRRPTTETLRATLPTVGNVERIERGLLARIREHEEWIDLGGEG